MTATQKVVPTGPWFAAMRSGDFDVVVEANCNSVVNPVLDTQKYLPHDVFAENYGDYTDPEEVDIYNQMLRETDSDQAARADAAVRDAHRRYRGARVPDALVVPRSIPERSYVKGWKISPSHYLNQDLSNIWLDKSTAEATEGARMYHYIAKRVLLVIPTLIGAAALVFVLMRLIPGDICVVRLGSGGGTLRPARGRSLPRRDSASTGR